MNKERDLLKQIVETMNKTKPQNNPKPEETPKPEEKKFVYTPPEKQKK